MQQQLKQAIRQVLQNIGATAPGLMNQQSTPKFYEIYILSIVVRAFDLLGAQCQARDANGNSTNRLDFRLAPGRIFNPTTAPGFILVDYNGDQFEVQNGVRVAGKSKVLHELDVCILPHAKAERCRRIQRDPTSSDLLCLVECKFYSTDLQLHLGREFVGLATEFSLKIRSMASNLNHRGISSLIKKHSGKENFELSPSFPNNVDRIVSWLAEELRQVLE
jgi:hypothetical protein